MLARIFKTSEEHATVLHVEGRLCAENVSALADELATVEGSVVLELANLKSLDDDGVDLLLQIQSLGAEIRGVSPYIEILMKKK